MLCAAVERTIKSWLDAAVSKQPQETNLVVLLLPSGMSVLADRMMGLEEVLQELAQYQVTNSALLQQLGGRISPNGQEPLMGTMRPGEER